MCTFILDDRTPSRKRREKEGCSIRGEVPVGIVCEVPRLQVDAQKVLDALEGECLGGWLPPAHTMALALKALELQRGRGDVVRAARGSRRLDKGARLYERHVDVVLAVEDQQRRLKPCHVRVRRRLPRACSDL
eukprot:CAMPEP_0119371802 /NCGR_PEP_ID=MMETSP1334-20130426/17905_1 /TAXON_ID=127549 /ORGANISM="Calcidiscus leptoporus, Strain RCC1130" /LENGTH=132 /DNA_ID=CAMNT_0007389153 /DNA_START=180 /DNA_END=574 /DNA_ORIENTATION=+